MSSPIHSYLFSPPPSPPRRAVDSDPNHGFTSIKSLLVPTDFIPRSPHLDGGLKTRSPRTPQQSRFTLDNVYPSSFPTRAKVADPEATPIATYSTPTTPRRKIVEKTVSSPPYLPTNVPSTHIPVPSSLPKPFIRLLLLVSLLASSVMLMVFVPSARLPSLRAAGMSRRLALDPNGRAYIDTQSVTSWTDARDKDYRPPQIKAPHMMRRAIDEKGAPAPHPRTSRPALIARPLPSSHELLAIQSYLLSSAYNVIPDHIDPSEPIDANTVLGMGTHKLGPSGGNLEQVWLDELKGEREDEVIVWYGGDGRPNPPHEVLDFLASIHGPDRKPTLIPCHGRSDRFNLLSILDRLSLPLRNHPIIMIGNKPVVGDLRNLEELRLSGELESMLSTIGWQKETKSDWTPKLAKVQKRTLTEVEEALKAQAMAKFESELVDDVL
ncbi:uncharacterized protein IL334_000042 [Kwoniella shivajii]|uniref:Uncharacterized protein n=1 Tax=Kwoniella shivajii TaxID=564305 RepID=A0ABZ1CPI9_9TREE|nr:hypothetical protein IL334_000042 [Kwoniella shivajii]